jgi:hypothetical protein
VTAADDIVGLLSRVVTGITVWNVLVEERS